MGLDANRPRRGIGLLATLWLSLVASAGYGQAVVFVDVESSAPLGTPQSPFQTVSQGVASVFVGGRVVIALGDYPEVLTITKPLTLEASGGSVLIGGPAGLAYPVSTAGPVNPEGVGSSALYAADERLAAPVITAINTTDNAVVLTWDDTNTLHDRYVLYVYGPCDCPPSQFGSNLKTFYTVPAQARSLAFNLIRTTFPTSDTNLYPLVPGGTYSIELYAATNIGYSPIAVKAQGPALLPGPQFGTLTRPTITIGDPHTDTVGSPLALSGFAAGDVDGNGVLQDAAGAPGAYPLFPDFSAGGIARAGNRFDGPANVVVGYFFNESGGRRFVAFHMRAQAGTITAVSVFYGDAVPDVSGTRVLVGPGAEAFSAQIIPGVAGGPGIIQGSVTMTTVDTFHNPASPTFRVVEFTFRQVLVPQ